MNATSTTKSVKTAARIYFRNIILLISCFSIPMIHGAAQETTADLLGTVTDASGAQIQSATVTVVNLGTQATRTITSSGSGDFSFNLLQPGDYSVRVEMAGFKAFQVAKVTIAAGDHARVNALLETGQVSETVSVNAEVGSTLRTDSSTVEDSISGQQVQDIPLNGRNFINLVQQTPGVTAGNPQSVTAGTHPDDRRQSSNVEANGQPSYLSNELLDGLDNNERDQGFIAVRPSIDAISAVRVTTSNYTAESGRAVGAVINIETKSGTNHFHGSAFEFFRNDIFNARVVGVTGTKPEYRQNQYGGSVGGPIFKNKTFFFGAFEQLRAVQGIPAISTVPTLFEEQNVGDFSDIGGPALTPGQISQVGANFFSLYPAPNLPGTISGGVPINNFLYIGKRTQYSTTADVRIDHHLNESNMIFGHYSYNPVSTFTPAGLPPATFNGSVVQSDGVPNFAQGFSQIPGPSNTLAQGLGISYTHIFNPRLVLELKSGYTRINIQALPLNYGTNLGSKFGIVNSNLGTADTSAVPNMVFFGGPYASLGGGLFVPILNINNTYQYNGAVTYSLGAHNLKFGAAFIRRQLNYFQDSFSPQGGFYFFSIESLLTGTPGFAQRGNTLIHPGYRTSEPSAYAQDDWHFNKNLTLNLGVRYEIFTPFTERHDNYSNFNLPTLAIQLAGKTTDSKLGIKTQSNLIAPRIGFAQTLPGEFVLRGGAGISYFPVDYTGAIQNDNPPFQYLCLPCFATQFPVLPLPSSSSITSPAGTVQYKPANFKNGYSTQLSLALQKQVGANSFTMQYVGILGRRLYYPNDADLPVPAGPSAPGTPAAPLIYATQLPNVSNIQALTNRAISNYHALQLVAKRNLSKGLGVDINYTWAHSLTDAPLVDAANLVANDPRYDYGNSEQDVRHRLAGVITYELPLGRNLNGVAGLLGKGWQANLLGFWESGTTPFTIISNSPQINLPGVGTDRPNQYMAGAGFAAEFASIVAAYKLANPGSTTLPTLDQYCYKQYCYGPQTFGTAGNEHANQAYGPGDRRVDGSLFKNFQIREGQSLQFRAELFNITNTPNFLLPAHTIGTAGFGAISQPNPGEFPRLWQFALRYQF